ncbi:MAG: saccharopine dehydrogenase C-terminal domain-containing protein [Chitinophagales bacterium]|nr:saccharopine dehydrogenase NADP-binding domain-containing protein [Bacteroidota bacterium]MCB9043060.1 saccharopine dehydrogenase NADP-binding domain-containing protein [Chitinophagales bacterium]
MLKNILILGAGKSSFYLINYLLSQAEQNQWHITVGDLDLRQAEKKINNHPCGTAIRFDIYREKDRQENIDTADIVVSLLPPPFHILVAQACLDANAHLVTASYLTDETRALDAAFKAKNLLFMGEIGLDPGIDHLAIMEILDRLREKNYKIRSVHSHTGALIAPECDTNPWHYKFSWAPMNVVTAGQGVSQYLDNNTLKRIPYQRLFDSCLHRNVEGVGDIEIYANRNSLAYIKLYSLEGVDSLLRGTIRWADYCEAWQALVTLGLTDNSYKIDCTDLRIGDWVKSYVPTEFLQEDVHLDLAVADFLGLPLSHKVIYQLKWLGLFSDDKIPTTHATASPAEILCAILSEKWVLQPNDKDFILMLHEIIYETEEGKYLLQSSMNCIGEDSEHTAIAKTVGLPCGIFVKLLANNEISLRGVHAPVSAEVYKPVLAELAEYGISFSENIAPTEFI